MKKSMSWIVWSFVAFLYFFGARILPEEIRYWLGAIGVAVGLFFLLFILSSLYDGLASPLDDIASKLSEIEQRVKSIEQEVTSIRETLEPDD